MYTRRAFFGLAIIASLALMLPADAEPVFPVKWSQLPDMGPYGYDWSSETSVPSMTADDFLCDTPLAIIDLHWWGSYYDPGELWPYKSSDDHFDPTLASQTPPGIVVGFNIEFYSDVPGEVGAPIPWSHPGDLLYEEFIDMALVTEAYFGTITHISGAQENVWQYNCVLPIPFEQDPWADPVDIDGDDIPDGTIYWLKIQAVHSDQQIQWGWHEADTLWHDNAVQHWGPNPVPFWDLRENKDMAFEFSVIPEPSLLLLAAAGLLALLRRRHR
jgi:hypothetical protein